MVGGQARRAGFARLHDRRVRCHDVLMAISNWERLKGLRSHGCNVKSETGKRAGSLAGYRCWACRMDGIGSIMLLRCNVAPVQSCGKLPPPAHGFLRRIRNNFFSQSFAAPSEVSCALLESTKLHRRRSAPVHARAPEPRSPGSSSGALESACQSNREPRGPPGLLVFHRSR